MNKNIRKAVFRRAQGVCEFCSRSLGADDERGHLDHFRGRAKVPESVENCVALCLQCDARKTANSPSAAYWVDKYERHCTLHGYAEEVAWAQTRLAVLRQKGMAENFTSP